MTGSRSAYLRCRILERIRRFLRPTLRRPLPRRRPISLSPSEFFSLSPRIPPKSGQTVYICVRHRQAMPINFRREPGACKSMTATRSFADKSRFVQAWIDSKT